jgi:hypothetical protein
MMNAKFKRIGSVTALFLAFATSQVYLNVTLAGPGAKARANALLPQSPAILITSRNRPISVNGTSTVTGATILTGALVETPAEVDASIDIPGRFNLRIEPRTKFKIEFDENTVKITLISGCVQLRTKRGTTGEIVNEQGRSLGKSDPEKNDDEVKNCEPRPGAGGGIGTGATVAIIGAGGAILALVLANSGGRGTNPSPTGP